MTYVKADNRGSIEVIVDGTSIGTIQANSSGLAWRQNWTSPPLTEGLHSARFVHVGGGTYVDIDAIEVHGPIVPPSTTVIINYEYDDLYRLTDAKYSNINEPPYKTYQYTYDAVGNRLTQTSVVNGQSSAVTYDYDDANRLTSVNGTPYLWDANGNLRDDGVKEYGYDAANRLKTISLKTVTGPSLAGSYEYNGLGDRLQETVVNGPTTTFTMDLNTGLTQALSDGTNTYIYGVDRIAQAAGGGTEYFLGDALGSVRQLTDGSGAITYAAAYDPYGVTTQAYGSSQAAYGYTGEYTSDDLVYLRARMYSATNGRFMTKDAWQGSSVSPTSYNAWLYADANPVRFVDPTGYCIDQPGSPRRCLVKPGDTLTAIASDRGLNYEAVYVWNRSLYGNNWDPNKIWPGNIIYLEDPLLGQPVQQPDQVVPPPVHPGEILNGYLEGTGFTFIAFGVVLRATGKEVVYDFETLQRGEFTYESEPIWFGFICGVSTDIFGIGRSWYTGFFHFPLGDQQGIEAYNGLVGTLSIAGGIPNPLKGPLGRFALGGQATYFISTPGNEILGVPTATDYGRAGVTFSVNMGGGSVKRLPVGVETMNLRYTLTKDTKKQYPSPQAMAMDIMLGKGTEFGVADAAGLLGASRLYFANKVLQIYGLQ